MKAEFDVGQIIVYPTLMTTKHGHRKFIEKKRRRLEIHFIHFYVSISMFKKIHF